MKLDWRQVNWFSKLLAVGLLVIFAALAFLFGSAFQETIVVQNEPAHVELLPQDSFIPAESIGTANGDNRVAIGRGSTGPLATIVLQPSMTMVDSSSTKTTDSLEIRDNTDNHISVDIIKNPQNLSLDQWLLTIVYGQTEGPGVPRTLQEYFVLPSYDESDRYRPISMAGLSGYEVASESEGGIGTTFFLDDNANQRIFEFGVDDYADDWTNGNATTTSNKNFQDFLSLINSLKIDNRSAVSNTSGLKTYSDSTLGVTFNYPSNLFVKGDPYNASELLIQSSPKDVELGGEIPDGLPADSYVTEGFIISIWSTPYTKKFNISQYLSDVHSSSTVDTITDMNVSGIPSYMFTFKDEIGAGNPWVAVPLAGKVIEVTYDSSFDSIASSREKEGLNAYDQILQSLVINP